jgi:hypothetical protein
VEFPGGCHRRSPVGDAEKPKQIQFFIVFRAYFMEYGGGIFGGLPSASPGGGSRKAKANSVFL